MNWESLAAIATCLTFCFLLVGYFNRLAVASALRAKSVQSDLKVLNLKINGDFLLLRMKHREDLHKLEKRLVRTEEALARMLDITD
jgi:hypothetical protein